MRFACRTPYAARISLTTPFIVIGKNARLVPTRMTRWPSFRARREARRAEILSFAEVLALLSRGRENVVVAGSFGKTTSVSMMAHCLASAGLDPSWMIGAVPLSPPRASNAGQGPLFLLEGDEYPSSNTDNRSKFLHYRPAHVLLTPSRMTTSTSFQRSSPISSPSITVRSGPARRAHRPGDLRRTQRAISRRSQTRYRDLWAHEGDWRAENSSMAQSPSSR